MYGGQRADDSLIVGYVDADYAGDLDRIIPYRVLIHI